MKVSMQALVRPNSGKKGDLRGVEAAERRSEEACKEELIWDYRTGDVICASTGEIVDRIYLYSSIKEEGEKAERAKVLNRVPESYRAFKSIAKKGFVVNENAFIKFMNSGNQVMVLEHPLTPKLRRMLEKDDELKRAYKMVEGIMRGRTFRAKVAAAMLIAKDSSVVKVAEETGLSPEHVARLRKMLMKKLLKEQI